MDTEDFYEDFDVSGIVCTLSISLTNEKRVYYKDIYHRVDRDCTHV